jgi:hypothetical protein
MKTMAVFEANRAREGKAIPLSAVRETIDARGRSKSRVRTRTRQTR